MLQFESVCQRRNAGRILWRNWVQQEPSTTRQKSWDSLWPIKAFDWATANSLANPTFSLGSDRLHCPPVPARLMQSRPSFFFLSDIYFDWIFLRGSPCHISLLLDSTKDNPPHHRSTEKLVSFSTMRGALDWYRLHILPKVDYRYIICWTLSWTEQTTGHSTEIENHPLIF